MAGIGGRYNTVNSVGKSGTGRGLNKCVCIYKVEQGDGGEETFLEGGRYSANYGDKEAGTARGSIQYGSVVAHAHSFHHVRKKKQRDRTQ